MDIVEKYLEVKQDNLWNFLKVDGTLLSNLWFDKVYGFYDGFARVILNGKGYNFLNTDGKLISDQWFDWTWEFVDGFAPVELNDKYNFINTDGEIVSNQWFDDFNRNR